MSSPTVRRQNHGITSATAFGIIATAAVLILLGVYFMVFPTGWTLQCLGRMKSKSSSDSSLEEQKIPDLEHGNLTPLPKPIHLEKHSGIISSYSPPSPTQSGPMIKGQKIEISKPKRLMPANKAYVLVESPFESVITQNNFTHLQTKPSLKRRSRSLNFVNSQTRSLDVYSSRDQEIINGSNDFLHETHNRSSPQAQTSLHGTKQYRRVFLLNESRAKPENTYDLRNTSDPVASESLLNNSSSDEVNRRSSSSAYQLWLGFQRRLSSEGEK
ncbi:expressed protein [Phakopsora pachyrhizi]|uniref:Expressed protein n=1 Tax=Phakopsora pachyrhizi TaxID=170000 RepID=A0AAV0AUU3_PHAPC|nr:expressed protein [Phakopsora pachyrhizi]